MCHHHKIRMKSLKVVLHGLSLCFNLICKRVSHTQVYNAYTIYQIPCCQMFVPHIQPLLQILGPPLTRSTMFTKCSSHISYSHDVSIRLLTSLPLPLPLRLFLATSTLTRFASLIVDCLCLSRCTLSTLSTLMICITLKLVISCSERG
jgi:hypothetical protein